jgi:hypothetical protein
MKCNWRLGDDCIEFFIIWTQIYTVIYVCDVMHKAFLQLKIITFKFVDISITNYNYEYGLCLPWKNKF